jgi:hypothetical protein
MVQAPAASGTIAVDLQLPLAAKLTARFDEAVAITLKSGSASVLFGSGPKAIC